MTRPIAVSIGDPAGIGPELIAEAWARREEERLPPFFVAPHPGLGDELGADAGGIADRDGDGLRHPECRSR